MNTLKLIFQGGAQWGLTPNFYTNPLRTQHSHKISNIGQLGSGREIFIQ